MYVNNGKISSRQTFRLYVFDLMGIATLLLPPYLAKLCGIDGVWAILLGTGLGIVYLAYLGWIMKQMQSDLCTYLRQNTNAVVRVLTYLFVLFHCVITAGFCAYVFANLMQYTLIRESTFWVVLLVIIVGAAYAVSGGLESRARVYEVLFWFILVPYVTMMLASVKDFEMAYVADVFSVTGAQLWKGTYLVFLFLTPLFFSLFLIGEKEKNYGRNIIKTVSASICVSGIILLGSYILLVGNFGENALASMRFPVVTIMSTIQFKGNFLKRMDALMLAVWFFTLYALLNLHLHYGVNMLKELTAKKQTKDSHQMKIQNKVAAWQVVLPALFVFIVAYEMQMFSEWVYLFIDYYSYIAVPIMVAGPLVLLLVRRKKNES